MRIHHGSNDVGDLYYLRDLMNTTNLADISWENLEQKWPHRVCAECKGALKRRIEVERAKIWDRLPSFFGLRDWKTLRANSDA